MRVLAASLAIALLAPAVADAQIPAPGAPVTVDGPSASIADPSGLQLSIARDGTGGLVYLKQGSDGNDHVFVSRLIGGAFQPPEQVDGSLKGPSSQPVVAAGDGGVLLVGFINGGALWVVDRAGPGRPYNPPLQISSGASNPSIQMTDFGKAYLAFTVQDGSGDDVRTAYYYQGHWALESAPLNATAGDVAGTGTGRPEVAAAGDGVAIVVWGEGGHVYSRRVWGTAPSVVDEQADGVLPGCTDVSADQPVVGAGGDSSYGGVAFHEQLSCGSGAQSRVLFNRLRGSEYDGITPADGLSESETDGADDPQIAVAEYGTGFVTSSRERSHDLYASALGANAAPSGSPFAVNSLAPTSSTYGVPALAGLYSDLIAWQQDPGSQLLPEVRVRYANRGAALGPETVLSSPTQGPTEAASGLVAGGDIDGNAAVAWVQGTGSQTEIVSALMYRSPGLAFPVHGFAYSRSNRPVLRWSPAHEHWGPLEYQVSVDGVPMGQTAGTSMQVPAPLPDGPHTWTVSAVNAAGLQSTSGTARVWVDTVAPSAQVKLFGTRRARSMLHVYLSYTDAPAPEPPTSASGIGSVVVYWGDGSVSRVPVGDRRSFHAYRRAGRYRITVFVTDKAGNVTKVVLPVAIASRKPPKPKRKPPAKK